MNEWWSRQEFHCVCQGDDQWVHVHRSEPGHGCARCHCSHYQPNIPEDVAIRMLIGPEMTEAQAANVLLGTAPKEQD